MIRIIVEFLSEHIHKEILAKDKTEIPKTILV